MNLRRTEAYQDIQPDCVFVRRYLTGISSFVLEKLHSVYEPAFVSHFGPFSIFLRDKNHIGTTG